jgi:hypothetical protein
MRALGANCVGGANSCPSRKSTLHETFACPCNLETAFGSIGWSCWNDKLCVAATNSDDATNVGKDGKVGVRQREIIADAQCASDFSERRKSNTSEAVRTDVEIPTHGSEGNQVKVR